jgi:hypothetical protein
MAALTTYSRTLLLNYLLTTTAVTRPTAWYMALHTEDPTLAGTVGEVTSSDDTDYVRKAIDMGDESSGQSLSEASVSWTAGTVATPFTVTHASIFDALTSGHCLLRGALLTPREITTGYVLTFDIGEIAGQAS